MYDKGFDYLNKSKKSPENRKEFNAGWIYVLLVVFSFIFGVAFFPSACYGISERDRNCYGMYSGCGRGISNVNEKNA